MELACLQAEGKPDDAVAYGRVRLAASGGEAPWLRWRLALTLLGDGRTQEAVTELERVVDSLPGYPMARHRLGAAYALAGRPGEALEALQWAVREGAGLGAALDLARALLAAERHADAAPPLEAVLRQRPTHAEALRLLAAIRFHAAKPAEAAELYERSWRASPDPRTRLSAAIAWRKAGQAPRSLTLLGQLDGVASSMPEIHFERAGVLLDLDRGAESTAELRRYLALAVGRKGEVARVAEARRRLGAQPAQNAGPGLTGPGPRKVR